MNKQFSNLNYFFFAFNFSMIKQDRKKIKKNEELFEIFQLITCVTIECGHSNVVFRLHCVLQRTNA